MDGNLGNRAGTSKGEEPEEGSEHDEGSVQGYLAGHTAAFISKLRQRQCDFLLAFTREMNEFEAARQVGVSDQTIRNWRREDPWFKTAFEDASGQVAGRVLSVVNKRAIEGWQEPVYSAGQRAMDYVTDADGEVVLDGNGEPKMRPGSLLRYDNRLLEKLAAHRVPGFAKASGAAEPVEEVGGLPPGYIAVPIAEYMMIKPLLQRLKERKALEEGPALEGPAA